MSMKRYCIVIADRGDGIHEPAGYERPDGQFVSHSDLATYLAELKALAERVPHEDECDGISNGIRHLGWRCNCARGRLLAAIAREAR